MVVSLQVGSLRNEVDSLQSCRVVSANFSLLPVCCFETVYYIKLVASNRLYDAAKRLCTETIVILSVKGIHSVVYNQWLPISVTEDAKRNVTQALFTKLFDGYQKEFLPRLNESEPVQVHFEFEIITIKEVVSFKRDCPHLVLGN